MEDGPRHHHRGAAVRFSALCLQDVRERRAGERIPAQMGMDQECHSILDGPDAGADHDTDSQYLDRDPIHDAYIDGTSDEHSCRPL